MSSAISALDIFYLKINFISKIYFSGLFSFILQDNASYLLDTNHIYQISYLLKSIVLIHKPQFPLTMNCKRSDISERFISNDGKYVFFHNMRCKVFEITFFVAVSFATCRYPEMTLQCGRLPTRTESKSLKNRFKLGLFEGEQTLE